MTIPLKTKPPIAHSLKKFSHGNTLTDQSIVDPLPPGAAHVLIVNPDVEILDMENGPVLEKGEALNINLIPDAVGT